MYMYIYGSVPLAEQAHQLCRDWLHDPFAGGLRWPVPAGTTSLLMLELMA